MKHRTLNTAAAAGRGALVVGVLLAGVGIASAQTDTEETPTTTTEETTAADKSFTPPWGDGEAPWGDGEAPWGDGEGPFGPGRFGGVRGGMPFGPGFGASTEDLAADLGMTPDELTAAFEAGQTLPEIAEANGVDLDELFAQRTADIEDHLDDAVAEGDLTEEKADRIEEMIAGFADGERSFGPGRFGGERGGMPFGPGFGGPSPDGERFAPWGDGAPPWADQSEES